MTLDPKRFDGVEMNAEEMRQADAIVLAELHRDAARYRWMRGKVSNPEEFDAEIDKLRGAA